jgi:hypothetical protein
VASLVPEYLNTDEWTNQWRDDRIPDPDVVLYKDSAWDSADTMRVIQVSELTQRCRFDDTTFDRKPRRHFLMQIIRDVVLGIR